MAGTMKFSEVPPYPYTCRSLHRVRTGKMRTKLPFIADRSRSAFDAKQIVFYGFFPKQWPPQNPVAS
ncbi:hypothetical protein Q4598_17145, partial [Phaeobacter inhibens]|uniref:hypothetical protein n=1 Tax=Phaeobacter inhibens TaxID=221822 RepID=UPI0026E1F952